MKGLRRNLQAWHDELDSAGHETHLYQTHF
jgi:hypothetical protein